MEAFLTILFITLISGLPLLYLILMIVFLVSKNPKLKTAGKVMLGILITIIVLFVILFVTCTGLIFFSAFS